MYTASNIEPLSIDAADEQSQASRRVRLLTEITRKGSTVETIVKTVKNCTFL